MRYKEENNPKHLKIGKLGEEIACKFLQTKRFSIIERNYTKKWGEIDIVTRAPNGILHFIEVKSSELLANESANKHDLASKNVKRVTSSVEYVEEYNPAENLHPRKLKRLSKVIQDYLICHVTHEPVDEWQLDLIIVKLSTNARTAKIDWIQEVTI